MNGVIVIDKPQEFTSFDVVAVMRRLCRTRKIGHSGTLDPMATGVLPILVGNATRAAELLPDTDKAYRAEFRLGLRTDTQDIWGKIQQESTFSVTAEQLESACAPLRGDILQVPPMMSAIRQNGVRLYDLARQGIEVEREARPVHIAVLNVEAFDPDTGTGTLYVQCSKGTYIRTLIADMGEALGCGAVMTALRRTTACGFALEDAITLEQAKQMAEDGTLEAQVRPVQTLFAELPGLRVTENQAKRFRNGGALAADRLHFHTAPADGALYRVQGPDKRFLGLGIYVAEKQELAIRRLFGEE
ncbi:MAG: tRNA pseudouridine(55) synthase TruB [Clostridia bacterium]|nr:tRNA pseudouridine(55) synthase TruB [Clostridia bacterium]